MALNDVGLCSRALIRIGAAPITSFNDGTAESEIAGALYAPVRDALLSSYAWGFAHAHASLTKLSQSPLADYQNAFALPNNYLRALSVGQAGRSRGVPYRIAQGQIHSDAESIILSYIFRPEEEEYPPYFDMVIIARLAAEFCIPVTENTSRADALYRLADLEFARARQIDAQQDTPNRIESFTLTDIRG
jgi:hypothetical protein